MARYGTFIIIISNVVTEMAFFANIGLQYLKKGVSSALNDSDNFPYNVANRER